MGNVSSSGGTNCFGDDGWRNFMPSTSSSHTYGGHSYSGGSGNHSSSDRAMTSAYSNSINQSFASGGIGCPHNGRPGISTIDILEHIGNREFGSAGRDWLEQSHPEFGPRGGNDNRSSGTDSKGGEHSAGAGEVNSTDRK